MNVATSKHDSNSPGWLVGVPKKKAPDLWWRIFFWPGAMRKRRVPEHFRSKGMYCPKCRTRQPFFELCPFCGCVFACFVVVETNSGWQLGETVLSGTSEKEHRIPLQNPLTRPGKVSLRVRMLAVSVMLLLLIALVVGIVRYRSYLRSQYAHNYIQALYVINSGMNLDEMVCNGTYNAWRGVDSSSASETSAIHPQALSDLETIKANIIKTMEAMGAPSAEYSQAARILQKLYALYEKTNSMVINSPDSLSRHKNEIAAARDEFSREIENLNANMPVPLGEELKKARQRYDLSFMTLKK